MKKLVKLEPVIHPGVKDLRNLCGTVESHPIAKQFGDKHSGSLLIPVILERLPNMINLDISRKLGQENWNIEQFLLVIHEEISSRENFQYLKQNDSDKKQLNNQFTTSSLHAQIKVRKCVFCRNEDHCNNPRKIVIGVNSRREISSKGKYCFNCLNPGHINKNYKAKVKWNYCQAEGSHHTALCFSENGTLNTIDSKNNHPNTLNNTE